MPPYTSLTPPEGSDAAVPAAKKARPIADTFSHVPTHPALFLLPSPHELELDATLLPMVTRDCCSPLPSTTSPPRLSQCVPLPGFVSALRVGLVEQRVHDGGSLDQRIKILPPPLFGGANLILTSSRAPVAQHPKELDRGPDLLDLSPVCPPSP